MIVDKDFKTEAKSKEKSLDQEINNCKREYSPEELKSIISFFKNPINKLIAEKLLLE